jgi:UDP-N-acetylmuramyl pentapeptide phosphotransferase/UDP-N-acetylglucosamine-1-phosphate transferase
MLFRIFTGDTGSYSLSVFYILLSRFPIPACLFILCIASLGIFYKRLSWNSHFTSTDHIYLWCNRSFKEYLKLLNRLYNLVWVSLRLIKREAVYEKRKLTQTRLCKYNLFNNFQYSL